MAILTGLEAGVAPFNVNLTLIYSIPLLNTTWDTFNFKEGADR